MRFFTSDTHFGHYNVIRYCNRPFPDKYEMDKVLIENWNKVVKPEDTVYHLGDVSFYGKDESARVLSLLNGYKIVIRGNHDRGPNGLKTMGFNEVYDNLKLTLNNGREVNLSHYPYKEHYTEDPHTKNKHLFKNLSDDGKLLLNGHVHEKWKNKNRMINVGVDVWNFTPVSEDELVKFITENGL